MKDDLHHIPQRAYLPVGGTEIVQVPDGYVVYDDARGRVHYLNPTASIVLELCGLCADEAAIARRLQSLFALPEPPDAEVDACLVQLREQMLIVRT